MGRRDAAVAARRAPAAPAPRVAGAGEPDLAHQSVDRRRIEADRGGKGDVDRILAAGRADLARVAGEAVGKVDADPASAEAILPDTESGLEKWLELNTTFSADWPNITRKKDSPADADEHKGEEGKYDKYFTPDPGAGD